MKPPVDMNNVYKVAPNVKEVEQFILGVIMLEPDKIQEARLILTPEDFFSSAHQEIFTQMISIDDSGGLIDTVILFQRLSSNNLIEKVGGAYYLVVCQNTVKRSDNFGRQLLLIKQFSVARKLIIFSQGILGDAYEGKDPLQMLIDADAGLFEITKSIEEVRVTTKENIATNLLNKIIYADAQKEEEEFLYTGFKEWDRINGPLFPSGVYIIAARPAMGKTAHAIQLICNMADKYPVGLINVEMTDEQLAKRIVSNKKSFNNYIYKKRPSDWNDLEREVFQQGMAEFIKMKLHIDSSSNNMEKIAQKIKYWVKRDGVKVVVIDYLQILSLSEERTKYMTETQIYNTILEIVRSLAKELNITIFLLCQLNRELYRRAGNKEPNLGDLKGSGKIEEVAFQISFLHRPEYYDKDALTDENGESIQGLCYQIIAKHRDGEIDRIKHRFKGEYSQFTDWESPIFDSATYNFPNTKDLPF